MGQQHDELRTTRRREVDILVNKYVDGYPYLCLAANLTHGGLLVSTTVELDVRRSLYALEIGLPDGQQPLWAWARPVWTSGKQQALRLVHMSREASERIRHFLATA